MAVDQNMLVSAGAGISEDQTDGTGSDVIPGHSAIWRDPLPWLDGQPLTRFFVRGVLSGFRRKLISVQGLERISASQAPFILVLNHSQALEVLLLPALLFFARGGKRVHFMADWNFRLIPLVDVFYRCGQVITLTRKPAKPRWLDFIRPWFAEPEGAYEKAARLLREGASVGIFPEGTINRSPRRLLKGYSGAAQLSLETGCPLVPAGIRFPESAMASGRIAELSPMEVRFGTPLVPPVARTTPELDEVREWHATLMSAIASLCGKTWDKQSVRRGREDQ